MNLWFLIDIVRMAIKVLSERKTRAILTITGIALGPLALVMISSVVDGYGDYIVSQIETLGQNTIVLFPSSDYKFTERDLDFIRSIPGVKRAEPFYSIQGQVRVGRENKVVFVYAIPPDVIFESLGSLEILKGNLPSEGSYIEALIGYRIAYSDDGSQVYDLGDVVSITYLRNVNGRSEARKASLLVSGVLKEFGGAFILSPDVTIITPLEAGKKIFGLNEWSGIYVIAESSDVVPQVVKQLQDNYRGEADIVSFQSIANVANSIVGAVNLVSFSASLSAFAVAVAGVAATMITSVVERTREIGVLKAVGFTDMQVLSMILAESILMSLIGGLIGIVLGSIGAHALAGIGFEIRTGLQSIHVTAPPKITIQGIVRALGLTILVGVAGGIFPAYRAAKIPPAVALRYE